MRKETWSIQNGMLRVDYITWKGKTGFKTFDVCVKHSDGSLTFRETGTNYYLGSVQWCNLCKCYTAIYNSTKFLPFIDVDINGCTITKSL